jgi:hypothetical protein
MCRRHSAHCAPRPHIAGSAKNRSKINRPIEMIDTSRAEKVLIEKHGRGVVVIVSVEES